MKIDKFKTYLQASGAVLLEPTNPHEVVRFRTINGVSVVYTGRRGYTFTGEAAEAYDQMLTKGPWRIEPHGAKVKRRKLAELIQRDGKRCWYCDDETTDENRTIEHILSVIHGGSNNMANFVIACEPCNKAVGSMTVREKVDYRAKLKMIRECK